MAISTKQRKFEMVQCTFCGTKIPNHYENEVAGTWVGISSFDSDEEKAAKMRFGCYKCLGIVDNGISEISKHVERIRAKVKKKLFRAYRFEHSINLLTGAIGGPFCVGPAKRSLMQKLLGLLPKTEVKL